MFKKIAGLIVFVSIIGFVLFPSPSFCASPSIIRIGAASAGGGYFVVGGAIATVLQARGMESRVQTTGGGRQNAILVDSGQVELGLSNNIEAYEEYHKNHRTKICSLMPVFNGIHHFVVRADKPIENLTQLEGKPFGLTKKGSTHDVAGRQVFDALGIKPKLINAGRGDTNNMVRDGLLVGYFMTSGIPIPNISELEATTKLRLLGFTEDQYSKVAKADPWLSEDVIPAGAYSFVKTPIKTFSSWNVLLVGREVPDELVYKICSAIFANAKNISTAYPAAHIDPKLVSKLVLPLHPGAVKYFEEKGIQIPKRLMP
jgi:TRAP transporter TAXI family solute receptor